MVLGKEEWVAKAWPCLGAPHCWEASAMATKNHTCHWGAEEARGWVPPMAWTSSLQEDHFYHLLRWGCCGRGACSGVIQAVAVQKARQASPSTSP